MDVAAAGFAASQIASGQRGQQAALSGIRGAQKQDQAITNLLTQAVTAAKQASSAAPVAPTTASAPSVDSAQSNARVASGATSPRGSLVNILA